MKNGLIGSYKKYWGQYILFNISCFAVMIALALFFTTNLKVLHPLKKGLEDFSFTDFYFKFTKPSDQAKKHPFPVAPELVIVNIGSLDRHGLADLLSKVNEGSPAVTSLDVVFHPEADTGGTVALIQALEVSENLIQAYISAEGKQCRDGMFSMESLRIGKEGFVNLPGNDPVSNAVRHFKPFHQQDASLAVKTAFEYLGSQKSSWSSKQYRLHKHMEKESTRCWSDLQYTIRYNHLLSSPVNSQLLDHDDVADPNFDPAVFNDKIVLLGFRGETYQATGTPKLHKKIDEDMYFTPLNKHMAGRSYPDMYGVDIQANVINNILRGNYIIKLDIVYSWLIAFLLCLAISPLMIYFFVHRHIWFHIVAKLLQVVSGIVLVYLGIVLFGRGYYLDMKPILVSAILIVDLMYFYDAFVKYAARLMEKKGRTLHSIFLEGH